MSFKKFKENDYFNNVYNILETITIPQRMMSGTGNATNNNIPNYYLTNSLSGGYYVDCFDRKATDPSASRVISFSYGHTTASSYFSGAGFVGQYQSQKVKMYRTFAKRLLGDEDKKFIIDNKELNEAIFVLYPRNQYKDAVYKNTTEITFYFSCSPGNAQSISVFETQEVPTYVMTDRKSSLDYEYAGAYTKILHGRSRENKGLNFLKAGVMVLNPTFTDITNADGNAWSGSFVFDELAKGVSGTTYSDMLFAIRHRFGSIAFSSSQNVNSGYLICRANASEFNYSSNPSFSRVTGEILTSVSSSSGTPTTYITTVGLLGTNQEVLAVAKTSRPIKKDPDLNIEIVVRLDY